MATVVSQHVRLVGRHLGFFKIFILCKIAANFTEISKNPVFADSNKKIIKNRVWKRKLEQIFPKIYSLFSISNFSFPN